MGAVATDLAQDGRRGAHDRGVEDHRPLGRIVGSRWDDLAEGSRDLDLAVVDRGVRDELHPRPAGQREPAGTGEGEGGVGEVARQLRGGPAQTGQVVRGEMEGISIRDPDPVGASPPLPLHRPLDPALELDRLEPGPEQPGRGTLEEALEEALEVGEESHRRAGV
jgi:hypothetical protein